MNLAEEAFGKLYPEKSNAYNFSVKYNSKFKPYNANIKKSYIGIAVNLSKSWKHISKEIQIGLIQELLVKLFKEPKHTTEMELYNAFIKNVHLAIPKNNIEPILNESFTRLNERFFSGMIEQPNLAWGNTTFRKLGCYEYGTDTITISSIFKNENTELLDYVMYHEMLHKKLKFSSKNGRSRHHTGHFREMEKAFPNSKNLEMGIKRLVRKRYFYRF